MGIAGGLMWLAKFFTQPVYDLLQGCIAADQQQILTYKLFFIMTLPVHFFALYQSSRLKTIIKTYREEHGDEGVEKTVKSGQKGAH